MSFMTPTLMGRAVYCACGPGHPRATASAVRLMSRFIGVSPLRRFRILASVQTPQIVMELFRPRVVKCSIVPLPCGDDRLFALNYRGNTTQRVFHAAKPDNTNGCFCW